MLARTSTLFDRAMAWSLARPVRPFARYLAATLAVVAIAAFRAWFVTDLVPWLLFIPAIAAIALVADEGVGVYACVLAAGLAGLTIGKPANPYWLSGVQWLATCVFLATTLSMVLLCGVVRSSIRRATALNARLSEREGFLQSVLAASTDCIKVLDLDGSLASMSEGGMRVMEIGDFNAVRGCPWPDFWHGEGNADARQAIAEARAGRSAHFIGQADTFLGTPKWWNVSVSPIRGSDGEVESILSVSRDHTELVAAQQRQELLNGELAHRLKNVLALVQSIANQTFRQAASLEDANAAFAARLVALAKATEVLTAGAWQTATLHDVIEAGLTSVSGCRDRIDVGGPGSVTLRAQVAMAMTLALHELATNAQKYGALSSATGRVNLAWSLAEGENGAGPRFAFKWRESGGPPVVEPTRKGFGSRMIERSLRSYFRGESAISYEPSGVVFRLDAPVEDAGVVIDA